MATAPSPTPQPGSFGGAVSRPGGRCAVCGESILPGQDFWAALRESPAGIERIDVLPAHWSIVDQAPLLAYWHTTMPIGEQKRKLLVDDAVLVDLFERLADAPEPAKIGFRFVLGLILMRKRLLNYDSTYTDEQGREWWAMKLRGREPLMDLLNPHLGEEQVADVSRQLDEILNEQ